MGRADELAVVRRALDLEHRVVDMPARARERLLELRLVVDVARARVLDALRERLDERGLHRLEPVLEVHGRDGGLEHSGEDVPAARDALELVRRRVARVLEQPVAQPELLRNRRTALARHDVRPYLREPPLRRRAEAVEHRPRDRELEDAVAQELEPFVRVGAILDPRGVGEYLLEPVGRELRDQAAELVRPGSRVGLRPDAR